MEQDIQQLQKVLDEIKNLQILTRVNNILLARFMVELGEFKKHLPYVPKTQHFFRFEILDEEYQQLINEYGKDEVDKALYRLDRLLLTNKQQCPNNIAKYVRTKLKNKQQDGKF